MTTGGAAGVNFFRAAAASLSLWRLFSILIHVKTVADTAAATAGIKVRSTNTVAELDSIYNFATCQMCQTLRRQYKT